jgi:SAM-dependent MidA family methyltransferase
MGDLLRAARVRPAFIAAARLFMVEMSPLLRDRQARTLETAPLKPRWLGHVSEIPPGPAIIVANEFFDALPIRQYQKAGGIWRERVVGLDGEDRLVFGLGPGQLAIDEVPVDARGAPDGAVLETASIANTIMGELAGRIGRDGGALIAIDYGYGRAATGDSFQAVYRHDHVEPLEKPGEVDLTAHVNFEALARAASAAGAQAHMLMDQGTFLVRLGLLERAGCLGANADEMTRARLTGEVNRLAGEEEMGRLFKVLAVTGRGLTPAPWG